MRKYKAGDKIVLDVLSIDDNRWYKIGGEYYSWWENPNYLDIVSEPLTEYTEKLEKKNENKQKRIEKLVDRLHRQAAEITRLLAENAELKKGREAIRDNAFEAGLIRGHEEAWELAQKMASMRFDEAAECFPEYDRPLGMRSLMNKYSYTEAAAKVAEWERQKEKIKADDIVEDCNGRKYWVINIEDGDVVAVNEERKIYYFDKKYLTKNGDMKNAKELLAQIGGGSDETEN